jgi:hypothetical protein
LPLPPLIILPVYPFLAFKLLHPIVEFHLPVPGCLVNTLHFRKLADPTPINSIV